MDAQKLIDNFSSHLKNIIANSIACVSNLEINNVEPIHLLYSMMQEPGSIGLEILRKMNITPELIKQHNAVFFIEHRQHNVPPLARLPELSPSSRKVLEKALILAHEHGHTYIGTEHLLYGLLNSNDKPINSFFQNLQVNIRAIEEQLIISLQNTSHFSHIADAAEMLEELQQLPGPEILPHMPPDTTTHKQTHTSKKQASALRVFTTELTSKSAFEKIDPVIGREDEIERIIHILARRTKNNPILVGEPGVGKTAIVEGLARKIAHGEVPAALRRKKIFSLDLTLLVAGTIYRGEFEARLKQIIDECAEQPNYILFVDEIHNIIGTGSNQGTMDAANILKPALARGQLRCIGATTYDEFKKYISSDPALERRFQKIDIEEPNDLDTLRILEGIKKYYESFHHVVITQGALTEAITLSNRYIHDNFQPDKAIDLLDEAASAVKSRQTENICDAKQFALEQKLEEITLEKEKAIAEERLKDAIKLKKQVENFEKKIKKINAQKKDEMQVPLKVTEKNVQSVLSSKMHIDKRIISQNAWDAIAILKERLQKHIIGQDQVLDEVVQSLKRAQLGMKKDKPFASFLFLGPSGVGKTELAKRLAEELYHDKKALIKLDMGEFSEGHSISKLLGSPAGYIGYKDRNPFLEKIKQRPYSVLLFDEIDKAHHDVTKLLLQILDEGILHDNNGKQIDLKHTVIIMTGNIGADFFKRQSIGFGGVPQGQEKELRALIVASAKEELGASLLSRINTVSIFKPLSASHIEDIIQKQLDSLLAHITQTQQINIEVDKTVLSALRENLDVSDSGARHIEQQINDIIPELLIDMVNKKTKKKRYILTHQDTYRLV
ncbi:MAG: ATP-dependent Clp protease ATP-binding subunit [Candidatus Magasanikbacteria bacterium]|nr:ATP-dependent Clp protease ATP-binding subunit [Candidatus Magasanikbacteria bacterium]